jgi:hypothetical protein
MTVHGLSHVTVKQFIDQVWMEEIPECICDILLLSYKSVTVLFKNKKKKKISKFATSLISQEASVMCCTRLGI